MDAIGYDVTVPEPPTLTLVGLATAVLWLLKWRSPAAEPQAPR
jgi:hypothetical protein